MNRGRNTPPPPEAPRLTADQLGRRRGRIEQCIRDLEGFDPQTVQKRFNSPEVTALQTSIEEALAGAFGDGTPAHRRYASAARLDQGPVTMAGFNVSAAAHEAQNRAKAHQYLAEGKLRSIALLQQAIRAIDELIADQTEIIAEQPAALAREAGLKVFIVHGHDEGAREAVARFLERLGFTAIILHEQANQGRTVIEKVEAHGDVGFAVVLLTPDDLGKARDAEHLTGRPRQNVLLELGYFIGRLGRNRVCTLKRGDLEIPSDFAGVVWEAFDNANGWKQALARELEAAEYPIDWNQVMR